MIPDNAGPKRMPLVTSNICKRKDLRRPFATKHESRSEAKMRMAFGKQAKTNRLKFARCKQEKWNCPLPGLKTR